MKLGLIAMSGVRAHNKELTELGLTLPGFVERNKTRAESPLRCMRIGAVPRRAGSACFPRPQ